MGPMASFAVEVVFEFDAESLETAGRELRRLSAVAQEAGFTLRTARVEPRSPDQLDRTAGTSYAPLDP